MVGVVVNKKKKKVVGRRFKGADRRGAGLSCSRQPRQEQTALLRPRPVRWSWAYRDEPRGPGHSRRMLTRNIRRACWQHVPPTRASMASGTACHWLTVSKQKNHNKA